MIETKISQAEYSLAFVTFLDILGFSKLVERQRDAGAILKIQKAFQDSSVDDTTESKSKSVKGLSWSFMSDSIVRVRKSKSKKLLEILNEEISEIAFAQSNLILEKIPIRGGLSLGEIYHENKNLFGPALVSAYKLETSLAVFPRVIIDMELFKKVDTQNFRSENLSETNILKKYLKRDFDGVYFIDYLEAAINFTAQKERYLIEHQFAIIDLLHLNELEKPEVFVKYMWLVNYHNNKCIEKSASDYIVSDINCSRLNFLKEPLPIFPWGH